jgi:tetratricopeptide (TPR) repeat protein
LADVYAQLAVLHVEMGQTAQAKRDEMRALQIREAMGNQVAIAFSWKDMAGLFTVERKPKEAAGYAQKAYDVLAHRPEVDADDRVAVTESLGFALTAVRNCERGIPILKDAIELSKSSYGADSRNQGYAEYLLGFGYWHCGNRDQAAVWFERGTTLMKADFGWDRDLYLNSMKNYARFLRENGQVEAAVSAEAVVHRAEALVEAQTLGGRTEGFRSAASQ